MPPAAPRPRPWPAISRGAGAVSAARSRGCRSPSACGRDTTARFGSRSEMGIRGRGEPRVQSSARLTATPCSSSTFQAAFASRAPNGLRSSASAALRRRSAAHTPAAGTCHDGGCGVARTWSSKRTTAAMAASPALTWVHNGVVAQHGLISRRYAQHGLSKSVLS